MPLFRQFVERRVPHYLAVYLGAGWGLVEFISFVEQRYALGTVWTDGGERGGRVMLSRISR